MGIYVPVGGDQIKMKTEADVLSAIEKDQWMMKILIAAAELNLPDWWICAGFVRAKIWDTLHGYVTRTVIPDVDLIYFDPTNMDEDREKDLEKQLKINNPDIPWSVKNEARMHVVNDLPPYTSSVDAISKFPETATAIGVNLNCDHVVNLTAPCGLDDAIQMNLKPTPYFLESEVRMKIFEKRIEGKNWKNIWPRIKVCTR
jgi:hypothetical protein